MSRQEHDVCLRNSEEASVAGAEWLRIVGDGLR